MGTGPGIFPTASLVLRAGRTQTISSIFTIFFGAAVFRPWPVIFAFSVSLPVSVLIWQSLTVRVLETENKDVKVKVLRGNKLAHPYKICVFRLNFHLWVNYPSSLQTVQSFSSRMTCLPHLSVPHGLLHTQPGRLHTCL